MYALCMHNFDRFTIKQIHIPNTKNKSSLSSIHCRLKAAFVEFTYTRNNWSGLISIPSLYSIFTSISSRCYSNSCYKWCSLKKQHQNKYKKEHASKGNADSSTLVTASVLSFPQSINLFSLTKDNYF